MSSYLKVPSVSHHVRGPSSIIHVSTICMIYERSLNDVLGFGKHAPWMIENRHQELRNMIFGSTFITDQPRMLEVTSRMPHSHFYGTKRILVSEYYKNKYNYMAAEAESFEDSLVNAILRAQESNFPQIWISGSPQLMEQAEHFADYVAETVILDNQIRPEIPTYYKYQGPKILKEEDRGIATHSDGKTSSVVHRLFATGRKLKEPEQWIPKNSSSFLALAK